jgi:hypothetical protein
MDIQGVLEFLGESLYLKKFRGFFFSKKSLSRENFRNIESEQMALNATDYGYRFVKLS